MSTQPPALHVSSVLGRSLDAVDGAIARIASELGPLAFVSAPRPFAWTDYYRRELGRAPARRFIALGRLEDPSRLPELKRASARLEVATARPGEARQVNIDPGLLNAEQLVLASTKRRRHRIYIGRGVFADLMLLFDGDRCTPLPWTYPDYAQEAQGRLMLQLRGLYLSLLRERGSEGGERCYR